MRDYEVVYIFHPSLDEETVEGKLERFHQVVVEPDGAEITAVDHWGVRQLAYPVQKQSQGYYVVTQFVTDPSLIPELERILKLDDDLLRFLVVLTEGEPTTGVSVMAETSAAPRDAEEEDEEEDEDEEEEDDDEDADEYGTGAGSPPEFSGGRGRRRRVEGPPIEVLNYKDVATLSRFVTEQGKILPKRTTKVTARFQRQLGKAVKRARYLALLPYVQSHDR